MLSSIIPQNLNLKYNVYMEKQRQILLEGKLSQTKLFEGVN
uniref:Uncharacterized protein n=1 Tax=Arundo donax TaxID=35708 RepID=A0A0A9HJ53_ARUDO